MKEISPKNGQFGASKSASLPSTTEDLSSPNSLEICIECKAPFGKGLSHDCKLSKTPENILQLVASLPVKQKERLIFSVIKEQQVEGGANKELTLSTKGAAVRLVMNPPEVNIFLFSSDHLHNFQVNAGSSSNFMDRMTNFIRLCAGKKSIPSFYGDTASVMSKCLGHLYKNQVEIFDVEGSKSLKNGMWYGQIAKQSWRLLWRKGAFIE